MHGELFAPSQEEVWAQQIKQTRIAFEDRVWLLVKIRNKATRKQRYSALRKEIGDNAAREVAKVVEGIHAGIGRYPRWFRRMP